MTIMHQRLFDALETPCPQCICAVSNYMQQKLYVTINGSIQIYCNLRYGGKSLIDIYIVLHNSSDFSIFVAWIKRSCFYANL